MILTGKEIQARMEAGKIQISPAPKRINPNSVNLTLGKHLMTYEPSPDAPLAEQLDFVLDVRKKPAVRNWEIPSTGFILRPGKAYLAATAEYTETHECVPILTGRSSVGRLGISVHTSSGLGDIGYCGHWTLHISVIQPVRIYAGFEICQLVYFDVVGDYDIYTGRYQGSHGIAPSKLHESFDDAVS